MANSIQFRYAIYFLSPQTKDPSLILQENINAEYPALKLVADLPTEPHQPVVCPHLIKDVKAEYAPPSDDLLQYFAHGVSPGQIKALHQSKEAFVMEFAHSRENVWDGLKIANQLAEEMARKTGGLIWDEETRELFSPDAWHKTRLSDWTGLVPDLSKQIMIHIFPDHDYVRAITLGMAKAGLPDVIVEDFTWPSQDQMTNLIGLFSQAMAEGVIFSDYGKFKLDIHSIRNPAVRDRNLLLVNKNSPGMACLSLKPGFREEGDPKNRLLRLGFDSYQAPDAHAQQDSMIATLFGANDSIHIIKHTEELEEASRKAKTHLPALREEFIHGLPLGEYIQVKASFDTPSGGREWMWVDVTKWNEKRIIGLLANDPFEIPAMHSGQVVEVHEKDVFDYLKTYPDKHREGNTTGEIIQKMEETEEAKPARPEALAHPVMPPCDNK
jgi:uncharacterized protein YegJ (DUF2314 family)